MSKRERPTQPPWSVPIRIEDVPETGTRRELVADETTRTAVAAQAGLRSLSRFEAAFDITRQGHGLHVVGEVSATVGQICVVSLEPIENEIREPVDIVFLPASDAVPEADPE